MAELLTDYAWKARGAGYANTVTDEGHRLMQEMLAESWKILTSVKYKSNEDQQLIQNIFL